MDQLFGLMQRRLMDPGEEMRLVDYLVFANVHDIKSNKYIWHRELGRISTFFMLPPEPAATISIENDIMEGVIKLKIKDFVSFWHGLDDLHKERRLLVDFMCVLRHIDEEMETILDGMDGTAAGKAIAWTAGMMEMVHNVLWIFRRLWIEKQHTTGSTGFQGIVTRFFNAYFKGSAGMYQLLTSEVFSGASSGLFSAALYIPISQTFLQTVIQGLIRTYLCWLALNRPVLERQYAGRSDLLRRLPTDGNTPLDCFMKKLRTAAPHWRPSDRVRILRAIETNRHSRKDRYLDELINAVGMDRFKLIAFGEEKFCASCGRSSYVGKYRLLCCKRCVQEDIKHKARYCNMKCQKAHWLKHKAEVHSGNDGKKR